jgi:hypothetical protein
MRYLSRGELFGSTVTNVTFVSRLFITIDFHPVAKTRLTRDYWENRVRRERWWSTTGVKPARELVRSTR